MTTAAPATSNESTPQQHTPPKPYNDINKIEIGGQLGKDAVLEYLSGTKKAIVRVSLASHRNWLDDKQQLVKKTNWVDVVFRGETAEKAAQELRKGDQIKVNGALDYQEWEGKENKKGRKHEIAGFEYTMVRAGRNHSA